jgi:hypothetical protein
MHGEVIKLLHIVNFYIYLKQLSVRFLSELVEYENVFLWQDASIIFIHDH